MRLLVIEHEHEAGAGVFAEPIAEHGWEQVKWRPTDGAAVPSLEGLDAVLALGGAMNVDQTEEHPWIQEELDLLRAAIDRSLPTLGVCLGTQLLAIAAGGESGPATKSEIGFFEVELSEEGRDDPLLSAMPARFDAFQWHSYATSNPPGAVSLASSPVCLQAYRVGEWAWGIQFHAEVTAADALTWTDHHGDDPAFSANGLEPERFAADIRARMPTWNEQGRALFERFCTLVDERSAARVGSSR